MELTELQKYLIACFKAYRMHPTDIIGVMLTLKTVEMQSAMLEWIRQNTTATIQELLVQVESIYEQSQWNNNDKDLFSVDG